MDKIIAFQRIGLTIAAIICSVAFLIQSTQPATAVSPNTGYGTGKYQMQLAAEMDAEQMNWYILVWDTETGQSKMYYGSPKKGSIGASASAYNLPSSPL